MKSLLLLTTLVLAHQGEALFKNLYKDTGRLLNALDANAGEPLILTPYLKQNKIFEAQIAAKIEHPSFLNVTSYAGYFTVDESYGSNIFFWYFPSADNPTDPVILWLNGGPGASSLTGLFVEHGPFAVNINGSVTPREYSWHKNQSVLYIDNPVGVGFSFTNGNDGLARNETKVGEDLHSALTQFFQLFPDLQKNALFIGGQSYAGKYVPAIGYTILKKNPTAELKINLQGLFIGNGWTDPINQMDYGPLLYNIGLIDVNVKKEVDRLRDEAIKLIQEGQYGAGDDKSFEIYDIVQSYSEVNIYNFIEEYDDPDWAAFLNTDEIRRAIHVGNITFGDKGAGEALKNDTSQSMVPWLEELLETYPVLLYTGQMDIICGYPMALDYIRKLNFTGVEEYQNCPRDIWYVEDEPAGYVKTGGLLTELMVRNSGHMVPRDTPKWAYDLIYKFTRNQPYA